MRDMRKGRCALCAGSEIIKATPAKFGHGDMERVAAVTYRPSRLVERRDPNTPHGRLESYYCRSCGHSQTFALQPQAIPIAERFRTSLRQNRLALGLLNPGRRRVGTSAPEIVVEEGSLSLWHGGSERCRIDLSRPFHVDLSRAPTVGLRGPSADVHLVLRQGDTGGRDELGVTLCLTDGAAIQALEPLVAFLPRLEGVEARDVLDAVRESAALHGVGLAI